MHQSSASMQLIVSTALAELQGPCLEGTWCACQGTVLWPHLQGLVGCIRQVAAVAASRPHPDCSGAGCHSTHGTLCSELQRGAGRGQRICRQQLQAVGRHRWLVVRHGAHGSRMLFGEIRSVLARHDRQVLGDVRATVVEAEWYHTANAVDQYDAQAFAPLLNNRPITLGPGTMHACSDIVLMNITVLPHPMVANRMLALHRDFMSIAAAGYPGPAFAYA